MDNYSTLKEIRDRLLKLFPTDDLRTQLQLKIDATLKTAFEEFAFQMINRGYKNYSVNAIFERIRWEKDAGGDGITQFKIGNNYRAFYARAFMKKFPEDYKGYRH